jgi:DNA-binding transcriptional MerR regulator
MTSKYITVKEIAHKYGLSYQVVNRYSDSGLLSVVFKKGNIRFYDRRQIENRIKRISKLTAEGYSLVLIRRKLLGI